MDWPRSASAGRGFCFVCCSGVRRSPLRSCEQFCTDSSCLGGPRIKPSPPVKGHSSMALLFWYVGFVVAGDVLAYLIGGFVEYELGSNASLIVFLTLYFLFLWISWILSVWMTEPKEQAAQIERTVLDRIWHEPCVLAARHHIDRTRIKPARLLGSEIKRSGRRNPAHRGRRHDERLEKHARRFRRDACPDGASARSRAA